MIRTRAPLIFLVALAACAQQPLPALVARPTPAVWSAPPPSTGDSAKLKDWWASWDDSTLRELLDHGQVASPTLAAAAARIRAARAAWAGAEASRQPTLSISAEESRRGAPPMPGGFSAPTQSRSLSVEAGWELDLFGRGRQALAAAAASARADARTLEWHDARVSLAAEIATSYVNLRACEVLTLGFARDATSRAETARLVDLKAKAGFTAPAEAALTHAGAAESRARLTQQRALCDLEVKALAMLTALAEPDLRAKLTARSARLPVVPGLALDPIPAHALAQRPDLAAAEAELNASAGDIGVADADRYPRINLGAALGYIGLPESGKSWSLGPAISLPLFDGGRRAANRDLAEARYAEARAQLDERIARAVREVEEALIRLASADAREADTRSAQQGFDAYAAAADARLRAGIGSAVDLEEARRALVAAQGATVNLQRERLVAWISLYRAVGGGWQRADTISAPHQPSNTRNAP